MPLPAGRLSEGAIGWRTRSVEFATAVLVLLVVIALGLAWNLVADRRGRRR